MTPLRLLDIPLADDIAQHAQSALALLQHLPLHPKMEILLCRVFELRADRSK